MSPRERAQVLHAVTRHPLRVLLRGAGLVTLIALAWCDHLIRSRDALPARAAWASRWLRRCLRVGNVRVFVTGARPQGELLVANHSSYLDSAVLAATQPVVFVARNDLPRTPIFGRLVTFAGTLFIDRARKRDLLNVIDAMPRVAATGALPAFYPEAGTGDGATLLRFRSPLFAPAVAHGWRVIPLHLRYELPSAEGSVATDVCWWGGMEFLPHLVALLAKREVHVRVTFGRAIPAGHDRKRLAREMQREIKALGQLPEPAVARATPAAPGRRSHASAGERPAVSPFSCERPLHS